MPRHRNHLNVRITDSDRLALRMIAEQQGVTNSQAVRALIRERAKALLLPEDENDGEQAT